MNTANNIVHINTIDSPVGPLFLGATTDHLVMCDWLNRKARQRIDQRIQRHLNATFQTAKNAVLEQAQMQLNEYFSGQRQHFTVPLRPLGTPFQQLVWEGLMRIPYGQTSHYGALAESIGKPSAVRAVANANGANAISLFIPCHRIIGADGSLTGYAGGLDNKALLLALEQQR